MQARFQPTPPQDTESQGAPWLGPGARIKKDLPTEKFPKPVSCRGTFQNIGSRPEAASRSKPWQPCFRCHAAFIFVSLDFFLFCNVLLGPPTPPEARVAGGQGYQLKSGTAWSSPRELCLEGYYAFFKFQRLRWRLRGNYGAR